MKSIIATFPFTNYIAATFAVYCCYAVVDNALYYNPHIKKLYWLRKALPSVRNWDSPVKEVLTREAIRAGETAFIIVFFFLFYWRIPPYHTQGWQKGAVFSAFLIVAQSLPLFAHTAIYTNYPARLNALNLLRSLVTRVVIGMGATFFYHEV